MRNMCSLRVDRIVFFATFVRYSSFMERIALFPGSFDPFTRGHEALVAEALRLFDRVVIGIGCNPGKRGLLRIGQRRQLIADCYAAEPRVEVCTYTGLTGAFAREIGAVALLRGVRNSADLEYERTMEATNRRLFPELATVMLFTPPEVADITSSTVRELLAFGHSAAEFLPEGVCIEKYLEASDTKTN